MSLLVAIPILSHQRQQRRDCRGIRGGDAGEHCSTGVGAVPRALLELQRLH